MNSNSQILEELELHSNTLLDHEHNIEVLAEAIDSNANTLETVYYQVNGLMRIVLHMQEEIENLRNLR